MPFTNVSHFNVTAAGVAKHTISDTPVRLYGIHAHSARGSDSYLRLFNVTTTATTLGFQTPKMVLCFEATSTETVTFDNPLNFTIGLAARWEKSNLSTTLGTVGAEHQANFFWTD